MAKLYLLLGWSFDGDTPLHEYSVISRGIVVGVMRVRELGDQHLVAGRLGLVATHV